MSITTDHCEVLNITSPKVALLIPTYNNCKVLKKTLKYLDKLSPQPTYYIFFTNNVKDNTLGVLDNWFEEHENTLVMIRKFPKFLTKKVGPYGAIALARQLLLNEVRKLNVDYAIFVDDDIFIKDKDFITKIISDGKDIVGGAYYRSYDTGDYLSYLNIYLVDGEYKRELSNKQVHQLFRVTCVGGGCLCLSNKVLMDKRLNFYPITMVNQDVNKNAEDFSYCAKASNLDYEVWVDDRFKLCHYQVHKARPWRVK